MIILYLMLFLIDIDLLIVSKKNIMVIDRYGCAHTFVVPRYITNNVNANSDKEGIDLLEIVWRRHTIALSISQSFNFVSINDKFHVSSLIKRESTCVVKS